MTQGTTHQSPSFFRERTWSLQSTKEISAFTFSPSSIGSTMRKSPVGREEERHSQSSLPRRKPRPQEMVLTPRELPLSPLLIQMFLRYLEGMLTRKRCPWAVSTSCRLFPGVLSTWSRRPRTSWPHQPAQRPTELAVFSPHPRAPTGVEGSGQSSLCPMLLTLTICCWSEGTICSPSTSFTTCFLLVA